MCVACLAGEVDGSYAAMEYEPAATVAALTVAEGLAGPAGGGHYSLVLHNGDLAYARGYSALWDAFLFQQQQLAARIPYMVRARAGICLAWSV